MTLRTSALLTSLALMGCALFASCGGGAGHRPVPRPERIRA